VITGIHAARPRLDLTLRCRCGHVAASRAGFRSQRHGHLSDAAGTREADCRHRRRAVSGPLQKGLPLVRCRTPIANTAAGPCFPVVALIHSFMDPGSESRPETRCSARGCAVSTNAPPSDRSRRRGPRDYRSGSSRAAHRRFSAAGCAGSLGQTTISALRAGRAHPERARSPLLRTTLLWRLPQSNWPTTEFRNWRQTDRQNSMSLLHNAAVFCLCSALRAAQNWHSESL